MSQPSTGDSTMTSEEHDQEVEEYIWNLMGKCGLLSEIKSQIAQFVQKNGKTKEKVTVDATRANPAILSMIYEYLKWVGMKNTCTLLVVESPVQFDTSLVTGSDSSKTGSPHVPELCTYLSERRKLNSEKMGGIGGTGKTLNGASSALPFLTSTPTSGTGTGTGTGKGAALNQTFNISSTGAEGSPNVANNSNSGAPHPIHLNSLSPPPNMQNLSDFDFELSGSGVDVAQSPGPTGNASNVHANTSIFLASSSASVTQNQSQTNNTNSNGDDATVLNAATGGTVTGAGAGAGASDSSESEHTTTSVSKSGHGRGQGHSHSHSHSDKKQKVFSFEKPDANNLKKSHKSADPLLNLQEKGKELKSCNSDQSLQQKSRDQLHFGFMTEKQKMEALNKKFSGSELIPKKKSNNSDNEDSTSSTPTASNKTLSSSHKGETKDKSLCGSLKKEPTMTTSDKDSVKSQNENNDTKDRDRDRVIEPDNDKEKEPENLMDISNPWKSKSQHLNNNNNNIMSSEPDFEDESISDLHDSTAEDITQDLSMDSDSKLIATNIAAECEHLMKLK